MLNECREHNWTALQRQRVCKYFEVYLQGDHKAGGEKAMTFDHKCKLFEKTKNSFFFIVLH